MKTKNMMTTLTALTLGLLSTVAYAGPGEKCSKKNADTDGDGSVSQSEFVAQAEERFKKLDADGDGYVTKDEAREARKERGRKCRKGKGRRGPGGKRMNPEDLFTDKNGDGVVDGEDLPEHAARILERVDTNEDGEISEEEKQAFLDKVKERREKGERRGRRGGRGQ